MPPWVVWAVDDLATGRERLRLLQPCCPGQRVTAPRRNGRWKKINVATLFALGKGDPQVLLWPAHEAPPHPQLRPRGARASGPESQAGLAQRSGRRSNSPNRAPLCASLCLT